MSTEIKSNIGKLHFKCKTPCKSCPYWKDAKLHHWHIEHFRDLILNDRSQMGMVYACHKQNGSVCIGWLMNQRQRGYPSIMLRLNFIRGKISHEYLSSLKCTSPMFDTLEEMCFTNFPELKKEF